MADDCIFCKIIAGEIPCAKVYESEAVLAFLDISPVNKGHALVIPKEHHDSLLDVPAALGADILAAQVAVGKAMMDATGATGLNVCMNNFRSAGQLVDHAHWHLIPRFDHDGFELWEQGAYDDMEEMSRMAEDIASRVK